MRQHPHRRSQRQRKFVGIVESGSTCRSSDELSKTDVLSAIVQAGGQSHRGNWERARVERTWTESIRYGSPLDGRHTHVSLINTIVTSKRLVYSLDYAQIRTM